MKKTWTIPAPTWPRIGSNCPDASIIVSAREMASANREMGTQMSVIQACASGTIDRDAQSRWCRAFHSKFRSSVAVADLSVPPPLASPRTRTISNRSEEHTSELQSLMRISYAVFCLNKKKLQHDLSHH